MKSIGISDLIAIVSLLTALISGVLTFVFWYATTAVKKYKFERSIEHLKNNHLQMQEGLNDFIKELDRRLDVIERDLFEIKVDKEN